MLEPAIITAAGAILIAVLSFLGGRNHQKAQTNAVDINSLIQLSTRVGEQATEIAAINGRVDKLDSKIAVMWQYIYSLVEQLRGNNITPIKPPAELESDPLLMKLIKK